MEHPSKLLKSLGISALKNFGQNFLLHTNSLDKLNRELTSSNRILEIGPGLGAVTELFVDRGFSISVCEKDRTLVKYLKEKFGERITVVEGDFLKVDVSIWREQKITQAVGNLPFNITTPIITRIVDDMEYIDTFLFGVQLDVAKKIVSEKGNSLAHYLKATGDAEIFSVMKKGSFFPVPGVDAGWVLWKRNPKVSNVRAFELILRGLFWGKRKNIHNSLSKNPFFSKSSVVDTASWPGKLESYPDKPLLKRRPDDLNFSEIKELCDYFIK